jgi:Methyltransferase domain
LREQADYELSLGPGDLLISVHACGALTDRVLERALAARCRVAVVPCCHDEDTCDTGNLTGWFDVATAITRRVR